MAYVESAKSEYRLCMVENPNVWPSPADGDCSRLGGGSRALEPQATRREGDPQMTPGPAAGLALSIGRPRGSEARAGLWLSWRASSEGP